MRNIVAGKSSYRVVGMVICHGVWASAAPSVEEIPAGYPTVTEDLVLPAVLPQTAAINDLPLPMLASLDGAPMDYIEVPAPAVSSPAEVADALPADEATLNPKSSQDYFSSGLPSPGPPSGFSNTPAAFPLGSGLDGDLLDGFSLSASLSGTYDSNPSQGYTTPGSTGGGATDEGDFFTTLGGGLGYRSTSSDLTFGVDYNGSYNEYFEQSELSGYNQSSAARMDYEAGPLNASLNVGVNFGSGANRYYAAVVDQLSVNYGLSARYRISPKTSLTSSLAQTLISASGGNSSDTSSFSLNTSALWRYSALTEFGPGVRYTSDSGESDRTSVGPTLNMNYKLAKKVSMTSQVGMEFAEYQDGGSSDPSLTTSIGLNYKASRLWGMNLSLYRGTQAHPTTAGGFDEITSLTLGYNRKIRQASLNLGFSYETNAPQTTGNGASARPDTTYPSYNSSLSMPLFANKATGSVFFNYRDQSGSDTTINGNGDSAQAGFRLGWNF